ncbi:ferredoxin-type protein NapF [Pararhizobium capsulatum DSM 1112]|uniref:Ferredoxin-type protein NapF n=1 Tax=Pararhizobium capsulatum DSM 1112 TaxID=1121113 RepID=A0ABU0BNL4_9HYPH|nr:ferredoxin-type protein NapF [Pararhizobium capsulatum]MDQ0318472.1 ferredoxin-type protein NapF [Pararhizobium capsulatum DSM 1112]
MFTKSISRRDLFRGLPTRSAGGIYPPGASDLGLSTCTGCNLCAEHCPTGIIVLVDGLPSVDFSLGACTFCGECGTACPEPVFEPEAVFRFPHVAAIADSCLAKQDVACQSCGESCPVQAIRFRPRLGGPFVPELDDQICSGCGACLQVCPVGSIGTKPRALELVHA